MLIGYKVTLPAVTAGFIGPMASVFGQSGRHKDPWWEKPEYQDKANQLSELLQKKGGISAEKVEAAVQLAQSNWVPYLILRLQGKKPAEIATILSSEGTAVKTTTISSNVTKYLALVKEKLNIELTLPNHHHQAGLDGLTDLQRLVVALHESGNSFGQIATLMKQQYGKSITRQTAQQIYRRAIDNQKKADSNPHASSS